MKSAATILACIAALVLGTASHAKWINWKLTTKPPLALEEALDIASASLKGKDYYCIGATLGRRVTAADWELHFAATDGYQLWVNVGADRSVVASKEGFFH